MCAPLNTHTWHQLLPNCDTCAAGTVYTTSLRFEGAMCRWMCHAVPFSVVCHPSNDPYIYPWHSSVQRRMHEVLLAGTDLPACIGHVYHKNHSIWHITTQLAIHVLPDLSMQYIVGFRSCSVAMCTRTADCLGCTALRHVPGCHPYPCYRVGNDLVPVD